MQRQALNKIRWPLLLAGATFGSVLLAVQPAQGSWTKYVPPIPVERDQPGMAFDKVRNEIVLFGGNNSDAPQKRNDTWTWNGTKWTEKNPATKPSKRLLVAMAFDEARGKILLFGGFDNADPNGGTLGDTWIWNGNTWTQQTPSISPPPRYGAGMVYDAVTQTVLLFGGYGTGGEINDTWSWNGTTWTQLHPAASPPARTYPAMSSDPARNRIVLFGGYNFFSGGALNDTWTWNGTTWTQQLPVTSPPARSFTGIAPDANGNVVLFGGSILIQNYGDTWTWNGTDWTPRTPASSPEARAGMGFAYDAVRKLVILFGGRSGSGVGLAYRDDTWTWDGAQWNQPPLPVPPSRRNEAGMAYDAARDEVVLFGGWNGSESLGDTWIWDGEGWSEREPALAPVERSLHAMAYDDEHDETVIFGGFGNGARLSDTWTWNGATWTARTPVTSPTARYGGGMVYDVARKKVLLFGGSVLNAYQNDTWTWDGTNWTQHNPATAPPPRYRPGMAYHAASGKVVLFGGFDSSFNLLGDTWTWDGTTWTEEHPAQKPSARYSATLGDSRGSDRLVLFGGSDGSADVTGDFNDTWTWNGSAWRQEQLALAPDRSFNANMVYETARARVLYFGGSNLEKGFLRDTWFWSMAPQPTSVVSRKTHGSAGPFDINLPLTGAAGVECRSGGATGAHRVIITFARPIAYTSAAVTAGAGAISNTTINGSQVTVNLSAVANAQNIAFTLFGVSDGTNTGNVVVSMRVLVGDTTGNSAVNSSDVAQTKSQSGSAVTAVNFRADVTVNGGINSSDISLVKSKSGTALQSGK
jgi:hypothetical protein